MTTPTAAPDIEAMMTRYADAVILASHFKGTQFEVGYNENRSAQEHALRTALTAASPVPEGWMDIASAPDRCIVAVKSRNSTLPTSWLVGEAYRNEDTGHWWWANESAGDYHAEPIHLTHSDPEYYQPLPAPPSAPEDTTVADRLAAARGLLNSIDGPEAPR